MNKYTKKSTRYSVNEYTCLQKVFRHSRFLFWEPCCLWMSVYVCFVLKYFCCLLAFFWNFVHYTLYRKQSFSRPSERQHPCAVALFLPFLLFFWFFLHFLLDVLSLIQWENEIKGLSQKSTPLFGRSSCNPHWSGPVITHHALSSPFGNSLLCFNLRKAKWVGCERVSQAPGNEWRTEGTNQRAGRRNMRRDVRVTSAKHAWTRRLEQWCTLLSRSSTTRAPPPSAPLLIWGRNDWLTVNEGLNDVLNSLHNNGQQVVELQYLLVSVEVFCWSLSTVREAMAVKVSASSFSRLWVSSRDWPTVGAILCRDVQCLPTDHEKINNDKDRYVIKTSTPELLWLTKTETKIKTWKKKN